MLISLIRSLHIVYVYSIIALNPISTNMSVKMKNNMSLFKNVTFLVRVNRTEVRLWMSRKLSQLTHSLATRIYPRPTLFSVLFVVNVGSKGP